MCFNSKKNKYIYLSMCSCCNVVSKYSSTVKKHLQTQHMKGRIATGAESLVIPIRIENKFEKIIRRTLDKTECKGRLTAQQKNFVSKGDENLRQEGNSAVSHKRGKSKNRKETSMRGKKTLKCSICSIQLRDHESYIHHITEHSDKNDNKIIDKVQCPYCVQLFPELRFLQDHVKVAHPDFIEMIKVNSENDKNVHDELAEAVLAMYCCPSCAKCFNTVLDLREHVLAGHSSSIANSRPKRKRKPPKWLESEERGTEMKKKKSSGLDSTATSSKQGKRSFEKKADTEKMKNLLKFDKVKVDNTCKSANSDEEQVDLPASDNVLDEADSELDFGDSDDDYVPEHSDGDCDESMKGDSESLGCINCDMTFLSKSFLRRHMKKKHNGEMKDHLNGNDKRTKGKKLAKRCAKESKDEGKYVVRYKCPFCGFHLYHYDYIRSHVQQSHPEVTNFRIVRENVKLSSCEENWESFKCPNPKCDVVCKKKVTLYDHMTGCAKGKFKNEKILCSLPKSWMERLENTVGLICPQCDEVVHGKMSYENHLQEHFPNKTFEVQLNSILAPPQLPIPKNKYLARLKEGECSMCPYCELVTTQKAQLSKHFKRFHSNQSGTSVISCLLANQSSVKETAKLLVKDAGNNKSEDISESNTQHEIHNHAKHRDEGTNETTEFKSESVSGKDTGFPKEWSKEKAYAQTVYIQSTLPTGIYMCPLCDDFTTHVKKEIMLHMDNHNSKTEEDMDSLYIIPDKWIKLEEKDKQLKCQFCDFSSHLNLTLGFRHILDCHKDVTVNKPDLLSGPLFKMLTASIEGVREKYEKQKYRCTTCVPGFIFKSKKGLQLHLKTVHADVDEQAVYESMYQMMDLVIDSCDTTFIYVCCLCNQGLSSKTKLMDHFQSKHPENLIKLVDKLKHSSGGSCGSDCEQTKCEVCDKQFTDDRSLKHHLILHMNRFKPTCTLCDLCFTNKAELQSHDMDVHFKSGEMCYKCGAMFPNTSALERHVKKHEDGPRGVRRTLCQHCGTSVMAKNMKKHMVDKHIDLVSCNCDICHTQRVPEGKRYIKCDLCGAVFCAWYNLRSHKHKEHNPGGKRMSYKCGRCHVTFWNRKDQVIHSHKCGKDSYPSQPVVYLDDDLCESKPNMTEITVTEEANIDFNRGLSYIRQKYIHVDKDAEKPFSCKLCPGTFSRLSYVYGHLRRMHTRDEAKKFRCKVCKMGFMGKKDFETHCRTHIGLRQYQCSVCQKRYKTPAHLKEHKQIHMSQIYRYPCGFCGLEFNQKGALLAHVVHHDKLKPFKCLFCEKGFTTHGDLQRHMVSYSKQSKFAGTKKLTFCDYCSKEFPNHNALVKHFQIHLPVSPFECTVCNEKFSRFRQMYNHKSKKKHFTDTDIMNGEMDLQAPGRKFRRYQVSKRKTEIDKERKSNTATETEKESTPDNASNVLNENKTIVEIDIDGSGAENVEAAKEVLEEFESDVIRSMLDADPEVLRTVDFHSTNISTFKEKQQEEYKDESVVQDIYHYAIPEQSNFQTEVITMQDMYEVTDRNSYICTNEPSQNQSVMDNMDDLAGAVVETIQQQQQTLPSTTRKFQTADGSIIHVCVIKPDQ